MSPFGGFEPFEEGAPLITLLEVSFPNADFPDEF